MTPEENELTLRRKIREQAATIATLERRAAWLEENELGMLQGGQPVWVLTRQRLTHLRTRRVGASGEYFWKPGLTEAAANTLAGIPYRVVQSVAGEIDKAIEAPTSIKEEPR